MQPRDTDHRTPTTPASPRRERPQPHPRPRQDWPSGTRAPHARSPQLGLRDADVVHELTATSR